MPDNESTLTETEATTTFEAANTSTCTENQDGSHTRTGTGHVTISRVATGDSPYSNIDIDLDINPEDLVDFNNFDFGADNLSDIEITNSFNVSDFTKNVVIHEDYTVTGEALFDIMMDTATKHLTAQYEAGRIRGEDYATGYVDIYKATLTTAAQLWSTLPKLKAEILQARAQALLAKAQAIGAIAESKYAYVNAKAKYYLALAQAKETEAKIEQTQLQSVVAVEQAKLTAAQVCTQEADTKVKTKQLDVLDKQIEQEDAKTRLVLRQTEGFAEDFKQKILKILMDAWSVQYSTMAEAAGDDADSMLPAIVGADSIDKLFNTFILNEFDASIQSNPFEDKYDKNTKTIKTSLQPPNTVNTTVSEQTTLSDS